MYDPRLYSGLYRQAIRQRLLDEAEQERLIRSLGEQKRHRTPWLQRLLTWLRRSRKTKIVPRYMGAENLNPQKVERPSARRVQASRRSPAESHSGGRGNIALITREQ